MRIFGLIGKTLSHSFSPGFFDEKFTRENFPECTYKLFPLQDAKEIHSLIRENPEIEGLNVTIPYKKDIMPLLDEISGDAREIGAVNTIRIHRGGGKIRLEGFNTDATGFLHACTALRNRPAALVLGTGGSAAAVKYILERFQIPFLSVSRSPSGSEIGYDDLDEKAIRKHRLIINTTPLGMYPDIDHFPPVPYQHLKSEHHLFDLIYNPAETLFLKKGEAAGARTQNGFLMLELQAERSWEIWNT